MAIDHSVENERLPVDRTKEPNLIFMPPMI